MARREKELLVVKEINTIPLADRNKILAIVVRAIGKEKCWSSPDGVSLYIDELPLDVLDQLVVIVKQAIKADMIDFSDLD